MAHQASESLDPRMNRAGVLRQEGDFAPADTLDQWQTFEVFHQESRGGAHTHVGPVHAPSRELALVFAKEQYARRMKCVNLWVVPTESILATEYEDADMFEPATDKNYREAAGYRNREHIDRFRNSLKADLVPDDNETPAKEAAQQAGAQASAGQRKVVGGQARVTKTCTLVCAPSGAPQKPQLITAKILQ